METATKTVEQMSEGLAQPDMQERFSAWANRAETESRQEQKEKQKNSAPREISLKDRADDEREWIEKVAQKDESKESAKESQRGSAERGAAESADSRGAREQPAKLTQAEADTYWRQISAGTNQEWQKAVGPELSKALGKVANARDAMAYLAAQPGILQNVKNVGELEAAVHMAGTLQEAAGRHPDAATKIRAATTEIMAKAPPFVQAFVNESEQIGELLYVLADQPTLNKLLETAKTNPGKALRVLHDMELDVRKALSAQKAPEAKPRAPKPPVEVGGRGAAADDGTTRGELNFRDFSEKQNQRYRQHAR